MKFVAGSAALLTVILGGCAGISGGAYHNSGLREGPPPCVRCNHRFDHAFDGIGVGPYFEVPGGGELHLWVGPRWLGYRQGELAFTGMYVLKVTKNGVRE